MMLLWLCAASLAGAAAPEVPAAPAVPEAPGFLAGLFTPAPAAPVVRVPWRGVAFVDETDSDDCSAVDALRGQCVEKVSFVTLRGATTNLDPAVGATVAWQLERAWEGLAYQWADDGGPLKDTVLAAGFTALAEPADTWDALRFKTGSLARPDAASWLDGPEWVGVTGKSLFPLVTVANGGTSSPPVALMSGRFAVRMGFDGKPYPYQVMDLTPARAGPFFEQIYPYRTAAAQGLALPFSTFDLPAPRAGSPTDVVPTEGRLVVLENPGWDSLRTRAGAEFHAFSTQLSVDIAQFALDDFTVNHMRVLAALSAMRSPPGAEGTVGTGGGRALVAAALGETDDATEVAGRVQRSAYAMRDRFTLRIDVLPNAVVRQYIDMLWTERPWNQVDLARFSSEAHASLGDTVRADAPPALTALTDEAVTAWLAQVAAPGVDVGMQREHVLRLALSSLVEAETQDDIRARLETWILLDHVAWTVADSFRPAETETESPTAVVAGVTRQWVNVLRRHGLAPKPIEQGLGAVDPTAICTTLDGVAAQKEPVFRSVNLDVVVDAADSKSPDAAKILWEVRGQLPFVMVDDPRVTQPTVIKLVGLPGKRALYRVRYRVWTGWHVLWNVDPYYGSSRVVARTAAICSDTVLAPSSIVPTLVRAALLDGAFRETRATSLFAGETSKSLPAARTAEVQALRSYALAPFQALADDSGGVMVMAVDVEDAGDRPPLEWAHTGTPYLVDTRGVRSAGWARWFSSGGQADATTIIHPAYVPTDSVDTKSLTPSWQRPSVTDVTMAVGAAAIPRRTVHLVCGAEGDTGSAGFTRSCADDPARSTSSSGIAGDLAFLATTWWHDTPRLAFEVGAELQLDQAFGESDQEAGLDGIVGVSMLRTAAGPMFGLRHAPAPSTLRRRWSKAPWGADRADGTSPLGRTEWGLRGGYLVGSGYNGVETTLVGEVWGARSLRRVDGPDAWRTPYNPRTLLGVFGRFQYGSNPVVSDPPRRYDLSYSTAFVVGIRTQWDLQSSEPALPELKQ